MACDVVVVVVLGGSVDAKLYLVKDVWARLGRQEPRGKKCKVGGKSLALFACSLSITRLPSLAERWGKRRSAARITIHHWRLYAARMWLQTASSTAGCQSYSSVQSHISGCTAGRGGGGGGRVGPPRVVATPLLIPPLNIYHSTIPSFHTHSPHLPAPRSPGPWFMTRSPSSRGDVFITGTFRRHRFRLIRKAGEVKRGWGGRGRDGWMEKWEEWPERVKRTDGGERERGGKTPAFHLSIHQRGDTALQIC